MTITTTKTSCSSHVIRFSTASVSLDAASTTTFIVLLLLPQLVAALQPPAPNTLQSDTKLSAEMALFLLVLISLFLVLGFLSIFLRSTAVACLGIYSPNATMLGGGNPNHGRRAEARGLDNDVIETFPTFLYSDVKLHRLGKAALGCAVCLSEFEDDDVLRMLPRCSHVFHPNCIDPWLTSHITCPVCRANLLEQEQGPHENNYGMAEVENLYPVDQFEPSDRQIRQQLLHHDPVVGVPSPSWSNDNHEMNEDLRGGFLLGYSGEGSIRKFPRSHSTGHSLVWIGGGDSERFALRLPEDVREKLVNIRWFPTSSSGGTETLFLSTMSSPRRGYRTTVGSWRARLTPTINSLGGCASNENKGG